MRKLRIRRLVFGTLLATGLATSVAVVSNIEARSHPGAAANLQTRANIVVVDADDIGGIVASAKGPEAGVWVIAETNDLHTKYRKIVVTDDKGQYLIPDLPEATYKVWVRGYGLVDGPVVPEVERGQRLALTATIAPNAKVAAQYYPANYWYPLLHVPPKSDFPMAVSVPPDDVGVNGSDFNLGLLMILDPRRNTVQNVHLPFRDPDELTHFTPQTMEKPSPYFGDEIIWDERGIAHLKNIDNKGRAWIAYAWRSQQKPPAFCEDGTHNKFAQYYPLEKISRRQLSYYDPKTKKFKLIDTCYNTRHAGFADDQDQTIYWVGEGVVGWVKPRILDEGGTDEAAQGWCPVYYDRNGDGKYEKDTDKIIPGRAYYVTYNPVDRSVWYAVDDTPGKIVRVDIGSSPPETCQSEAYEPPFDSAKAPGKLGFFPRGIDADGKGLIWTGLAGSGQLASFDRSKCAVKSGPGTMEDLQR